MNTAYELRSEDQLQATMETNLAYGLRKENPASESEDYFNSDPCTHSTARASRHHWIC